MNNVDKIYYMGKAAQLVLDLEANICCIEQIAILAEVLETEGEEATRNLIIMGEMFKNFLLQPESELDF